jgi:hypothetical protein
MQVLFSDWRIDYDGSQLRSGWLAGQLGLAPDAEGAVAAFLGGCDVKPEFVVDLEEVASGEPIRAALMLHFIAEFPERDLEKAVLRQRLLAATVRDELARRVMGSGPLVVKGPDPVPHGEPQIAESRLQNHEGWRLAKAELRDSEICPSTRLGALSLSKGNRQSAGCREPGSDPIILRRGDDLYDGEFKLSVSIATLSPVSALVHFAINVDPTGAPVPARGLTHYGVDPRGLAEAVLSAYSAETSGVRRATRKVRPVK